MDEKSIIETLAKSLFQSREVTLPNGRKVQFQPLYGDVDQARKEWVREGRDIIKECADEMMSKTNYRGTRNVVRDEMKTAEIVNTNELDELQSLYDDSGSTVTF